MQIFFSFFKNTGEKILNKMFLLPENISNQKSNPTSNNKIGSNKQLNKILEDLVIYLKERFVIKKNVRNNEFFVLLSFLTQKCNFQLLMMK